MTNEFMQKKTCVRRAQHYPCSRNKITYSVQYCSVVHPSKTLDLLHALLRRACKMPLVFSGCTTEQYCTAVYN